VGAEFLWVGAIGGLEEGLVRRAGLPFVAIPGGGLHGVGLGLMLRNAVKLVRGFVQAWGIVGRFQPDALFLTGGYVSAPVALACWLRRVPILIYLPDVEPGLAIKTLAHLATRVAVTTEASRAYLPPEKVIVTGYPVRPTLRGVARATAQRTFGLDPALKTLLVLGGSRGARSINQAIMAILEDVLAECQVIHSSGTLDWEQVAARRETLPAALKARYHAYPYLHEEMGAALAAADLAVSRAGASVLGEFPLFGLPSILVPYPHAWRYQRVNADTLAAQGAAIRLDDADLRQKLLPTVQRLLRDDAARAQMAARARALAVPDAAERLAGALRALC
jgi:undecaprenyldiphospho-muramoylpentapeptide beta-N-acetylglucosaminyltransferase